MSEESALERVIRLSTVVVPEHERRTKTGQVQHVRTYTYNRESIGHGIAAKAGTFQSHTLAGKGPQPRHNPITKPSPPQFETVSIQGKPVHQMTQASHDAHLARVRELLRQAQFKGQETSVSQVTKRGVWTPERSAQHKQIIDDMMAEVRRRGVPRDRKAVMSGGLGGSGKSTVLATPESGINHDDYVELNPDVMKEQLLKRGMAPDVPGLQPMEKAPLIHEESSYLAKRLSDAAQAEGYNVLWDITMSNDDQVAKRLDQLKKNGYNTQAVFVSIPVETSVQRALGRHNQGATEYLTNGGKGLGGRYVDPKVIRRAASWKPGFRSHNEEVFNRQKDKFSDWKMFDTSAGAPKLVGSKKTGMSPNVNPAARDLPVGTGWVWAGKVYKKQADGSWSETPMPWLNKVKRLTKRK